MTAASCSRASVLRSLFLMSPSGFLLSMTAIESRLKMTCCSPSWPWQRQLQIPADALPDAAIKPSPAQRLAIIRILMARIVLCRFLYW